MRVATILGTRPEIIKMALLIPLLDKNFEHTFIFTGQHYEKNMKDVFFEELNIRKPDITLEIKSSNHSDLLPYLKKVAKELSDVKYVIVYGDTNSTLSAALSAVKFGKKLIHIEAGLRSFDSRMQEELVRILVDHLSDFLFTPTELSSFFLEIEGIKENKFVVGNLVVDSVLYYRKKVRKESDILNRLGVEENSYVTLTLHRAENVDNLTELKRIFIGVGKIPYKIIYPIHPRTKRRLGEFGLHLPSNIIPIDPLGYLDMLVLIENSKYVLTDSGGIQEEAITLGVPCITLRETTERWETISLGVNFLVGSDPILISYIARMIELTNLKEHMKDIKNPYGDGNTRIKIVNKLKEILK